MTRQGLAGGVSLQLEPLQTTEAHAYWRVFLSGRTDLPTGDLKIHLDRYLGLTPEEQRSHFSAKKDGDGPPEGGGPSSRRRSDGDRRAFRGPIRARVRLVGVPPRVRPHTDGGSDPQGPAPRRPDAAAAGGGRGPRFDAIFR